MERDTENKDGTPRPLPLCSDLVKKNVVSADLWFSDDEFEAKEAADICSQCPVRLECLRQAKQNKEQYGIWGGIQFPTRRRAPK